MDRNELIERYFAAWRSKDISVLTEIFNPEAFYSECYGPEYHGIEQIKQWFADWNQTGTVLIWNAKRFLTSGNTLVVEWYFVCVVKGERSGFDGVSLVEFDANGKILRIKEFQSKAEHVCPYG